MNPDRSNRIYIDSFWIVFYVIHSRFTEYRVPFEGLTPAAPHTGWANPAPARRVLLPIPSRCIAAAAPLLPFVLLLALWSLAAAQAWLPAQILPTPTAVAAALADLITQGDLTDALAISLRRILIGFTAGSLAGLTLGLALGRSATLEAWIGPALRGAAQIPTIGWLPILILLLGLGEPLAFILIAKAAFVPVVLNTADAIRTLPTAWKDVARSLRLRRRTLLRRVLLPAILPRLFTGLRQGLAQSWIALVMVEMLAGSDGIGYLLAWGRTLFQIDIVLSGILVIGTIGWSLDRALAWCERRLQRWSPTHG